VGERAVSIYDCKFERSDEKIQVCPLERKNDTGNEEDFKSLPIEVLKLIIGREEILLVLEK
jgi:hypothetical protein